MVGIKVPGYFVPGTVDGFVTEARWVRGTYIVVNTVEEANLIPMSVRVDGTLVYVVSTDTEYRWVAGDWEVIPKSFSDAPTDGKIYARQNGLWTIIDLDSINTSIESITQELSLKANSSDLSTLQEQLEQIDASLANYVPRTELQNYTQMKQGPLPEKGEANTLYFVQSETGYEFYIWWNDDAGFALIGSTDSDLTQYYTRTEVDELISEVEDKIPDISNLATKQELAEKADINSIPTSLSQLSNDAGFITNTVDNLTNYDTTSVVDSKLALKADRTEIPDVSNFVTNDELTSKLDTKQDNLISGTNIKTINGQPILGEGDLAVEATEVSAEAVSSALDELYGDSSTGDSTLILDGNS